MIHWLAGEGWIESLPKGNITILLRNSDYLRRIVLEKGQGFEFWWRIPTTESIFWMTINFRFVVPRDFAPLPKRRNWGKLMHCMPVTLWDLDSGPIAEQNHLHPLMSGPVFPLGVAARGERIVHLNGNFKNTDQIQFANSGLPRKIANIEGGQGESGTTGQDWCWIAFSLSPTDTHHRNSAGGGGDMGGAYIPPESDHPRLFLKKIRAPPPPPKMRFEM